jgi:hypothetical protein
MRAWRKIAPTMALLAGLCLQTTVSCELPEDISIIVSGDGDDDWDDDCCDDDWDDDWDDCCGGDFFFDFFWW